MTALSTIDQLADSVEDHVPECPRNLILDTLKSWARRFCAETGRWIDSQEITTVADQAGYTLTPPAGGVIREVLSVTPEDATYPLGSRVYTYSPEDGKLTFTPSYVPGYDGDTFTVVCRIDPEYRPSSFPTWLIEQYGEGIAAGATAELAELPRRPWTNPDVAARRMRIYRNAVIDAKRWLDTKGTNRPASITPG